MVGGGGDFLCKGENLRVAQRRRGVEGANPLQHLLEGDVEVAVADEDGVSLCGS